VQTRQSNKIWKINCQTFRGNNEVYMDGVNSLDNQIDQLVYKLYGLTQEEVEVLEERKNE